MIQYKTKEDFNEAKNGESFDDSSIYFIEDSNEVYTHGEYYKRYEWGEDIGDPSISPKNSVAGDIVFWTGKKKLIKRYTTEEEIQTAKDKRLKPIGVVVIPGSHDVYGTRQCGIMSLLSMDPNNPTKGSKDELKLSWDIVSSQDVGLTKYTLINQVTNVTDNILGNPNSDGSLPSTSTNREFVSMSADGVAKYRDTRNLVPSPYLADGSRNPNYYSKELSELNVLSDFNGYSNTLQIVNKRGSDAEAAYACSQFKTDGTESGDWYLPTCGEFGYMIARFNEIQSALAAVRTVYGDSYALLLNINGIYYSSNELNNNQVWQVYTDSGYTWGHGQKKQDSYSNYLTRAFTRL